MKPNKRKGRVVAALLAVIVCMAAFSVSVTAVDYYASDEYGNNTPPDSLDSITVDTESVKLPENQGDESLTPDGNLSLIDDILQDSGYFVSEERQVDNKQFITVQSKSGNYFYLVIDRSGDKENVYFLNLVDEADLFALLETEEETEKPAETETEPAPVCTCEDKCIAGEVNTKCEVCKLAMKECIGKEEVQTPPVTEPETPKKNNPLLLLLPLLLIGGGAAWYFKMYKPKQQNKGKTDLDDYDFGDDGEDDPVEYETVEETDENIE